MRQKAFDCSEFLKGLDLADKKTRRAAEDGMRSALVALRRDGTRVEPKVPFDKGDLRANVEFETGKSPKEITGDIIYNSVYATRLHEEEMVNYTTPGTGPNYLRSKLLSRYARYMKIVAEAIKEALSKK